MSCGCNIYRGKSGEVFKGRAVFAIQIGLKCHPHVGERTYSPSSSATAQSLAARAVCPWKSSLPISFKHVALLCAWLPCCWCAESLAGLVSCWERWEWRVLCSPSSPEHDQEATWSQLCLLLMPAVSLVAAEAPQPHFRARGLQQRRRKVTCPPLQGWDGKSRFPGSASEAPAQPN